MMFVFHYYLNQSDFRGKPSKKEELKGMLPCMRKRGGHPPNNRYEEMEYWKTGF